jgi:hypothetical protein
VRAILLSFNWSGKHPAGQLGCHEICDSYENRADAFAKLKDYQRSVDGMAEL